MYLPGSDTGYFLSTSAVIFTAGQIPVPARAKKLCNYRKSDISLSIRRYRFSFDSNVYRLFSDDQAILP